MEDYSQLPEDIVAKIVKDHLHCFSQLLPFSGVCKSWRSAALRDYTLRRQGLPGLLISPKSNPDSHEFKPLTEFVAPTTSYRSTGRQQVPRRVTIPLGFRPITHRRVGLDPFEIFMEERRRRPRNNPCVASKDGWVLVVEFRPEPKPGPQPKPVRPYLLNPITREFITLPPLRRPPTPTSINGTTITLGSVKHAIITSSPHLRRHHHDDCHVILFVNLNDIRQLAWSKVGGSVLRREQRDWKFTREKDSNLLPPHPEDAAYFGGKLYLVDYKCVHVIENPTQQDPATSIVVKSIPFPFASAILHTSSHSYVYGTTIFSHLSCLNDDQLLLVHRRSSRDMTHHFQVYKLKLPDIGGSYDDWEEVRSLDGHALFLGYSHESLCLPAAAAPNYINGVREDRIYFAFSFDYGGYDLEYADGFTFYDTNRNECGVFNLSDQSMERFAREPLSKHNYFWFLPVPWNVSVQKKKENDHEINKGKDKNLSIVEAGWKPANNKKKKSALKNQHQQQCNNNVNTVTVCRRTNKFQALSLADDEGDEDDDE